MLMLLLLLVHILVVNRSQPFANVWKETERESGSSYEIFQSQTALHPYLSITSASSLGFNHKP